MEFALVPQDDFLLVTATGQVSVEEVVRVFKNAIDAATELGFEQILIDFSEVTGELDVMDLHRIGKGLAEYCMSKSIYPKVALIGKPPLVTGFGAQVASNRGLTSMTFSERQPALNWLRAFGSRGRIVTGKPPSPLYSAMVRAASRKLDRVVRLASIPKATSASR